MASEANRLRLMQVVEQIFEDGAMDAAEKEELKALYREAGFTIPEVKDVFQSFVAKTWGEVIEDGVVDAAERAKLHEIVSQLKLPQGLLPEGLRRILAEDR